MKSQDSKEVSERRRDAELYTQAVKVARADALTNTQLNLGGSRITDTTFTPPELLSDLLLEQLYHGHDLAHTFFTELPSTATKEGFELTLVGDDDAADKVKQVKDYLDDLGALPKLRQAAVWGNVFGAGALYLGVDGAGSFETPLLKMDGAWPEGARLRFINTLSKLDFTQVLQWYDNPLAPKHLELELLEVRAGTRDSLANVRVSQPVHASRCVWFWGIPVTRQFRDKNNRWPAVSTLQPVWEVLQAFGVSWGGFVQMLTDASQGVLQIDGYRAALGTVEGRAALAARAELVDLYRSVARTMIIDAKDSFTRVPQQFGGLDGAIQQLYTRLAAAFRMPLSILMGQSPTGMGDTSEQDMRWWYDRAQTEQMQRFTPPLVKLAELAAQTLDIQAAEGAEWGVEWPSLWTATPVEAQQARKTELETAAVAVQAGMALAEEAAISLLGDGEFIQIDVAAREKALELAYEDMADPPAEPIDPMGEQPVTEEDAPVDESGTGADDGDEEDPDPA